MEGVKGKERMVRIGGVDAAWRVWMTGGNGPFKPTMQHPPAAWPAALPPRHPDSHSSLPTTALSSSPPAPTAAPASPDAAAQGPASLGSSNALDMPLSLCLCLCAPLAFLLQVLQEPRPRRQAQSRRRRSLKDSTIQDQRDSRFKIQCIAIPTPAIHGIRYGYGYYVGTVYGIIEIHTTAGCGYKL